MKVVKLTKTDDSTVEGTPSAIGDHVSEHEKSLGAKAIVIINNEVHAVKEDIETIMRAMVDDRNPSA